MSSTDDDASDAAATVVEQIVSTVLSDSMEADNSIRDTNIKEQNAESEDKILRTAKSIDQDTTGDSSSVKEILATNEPKPASAKVDKTMVKERQLQEARQMWAIFEALGPGKGPKKCERPFTGRQQELYQECVAITSDIHSAELNHAALQEKFTRQLALLETLFIAWGWNKVKNKKEVLIPGGPSDYLVNIEQMNVIQAWFFELDGYLNTRKSIAKKLSFVPQLKRVFESDDLCRRVSLVHSMRDPALDILTVSTIFHEKAYQITIRYNTSTDTLIGVNYLNLDASFIESDMENEDMNEFSPKKTNPNTKELHRIIECGIIEQCSARMLIRSGIWKWLDEESD